MLRRYLEKRVSEAMALKRELGERETVAFAIGLDALVKEVVEGSQKNAEDLLRASEKYSNLSAKSL